MGLLLVGHKTIKVDVRVNLGKIGFVKVPRVHLEHLHHQRRNILHKQIQHHRLINLKFGTIRRREIDVNPLPKRLERLRRQKRCPSLAIPQTILHLHLGKQMPQVIGVDKGFILPRRLGIHQEMLEIGADHLLIGSHRRQQSLTGIVHPQVGRITNGRFRLDQRLGHVVLLARKRKIFKKSGLAENTLTTVMNKPLVLDMGLEAIVNRGQPVGKGLESIQKGGHLIRMTPPITVRSRLQLGQP